MESQSKRPVDLFSIFLGILYILAAGVIWINPLLGVEFILYLLAAAAILRGIFLFFLYRNMKQIAPDTSPGLILLGLINLGAGLIILFNVWWGILTLLYVLAGWIIIDSIGYLFTLNREEIGSRFWLHIGLGILGLVVGVLLIIDPVASIMGINTLVGIYFASLGVSFILRGL